MIIFKFLTVVILAFTIAACVVSGKDSAEIEENAA